MEGSLKASEGKLSGAQQRVQKLELSNDTGEQLAGKLEEAENVSDAFQEHVQYVRLT